MRPFVLVLLAGCPWVSKHDLEDRTDVDGDGYRGEAWGGSDCDDGDPAVGPHAAEVVGNLADENCDGVLDCFGDADEDGYGTGSVVVERPAPDCLPGGSDVAGDCDDDDVAVNPGAADPAVGVDGNCDERVACYPDGDGDGYADDAATPVLGDDAVCTPPTETTVLGDCDDGDPVLNTQEECRVCDDLDEDGICDEKDPCPGGDNYTDADGDGLVAGCDPDDTDSDTDDDRIGDAEDTDALDPDVDDNGVCDAARLDNDGDGVDPADPCRSVWFVAQGAGAGGDGLSWATAFDEIPDVDPVAEYGHDVWISVGTYERIGPTRSPVLFVRNGVSYYGGWLGVETTFEERPARPTDAGNATVLDGDEGAVGPDASDAYHVVETVDLGASATDWRIDGFVVRGGYADGVGGPAEGAGTLLVDGMVGTIAHCVFDGNTAVGDGGAIHNNGTLTMEDVWILDAVGGRGGGLFTTDDLTWLGGGVANSTADEGGGLFVNDGTATVLFVDVVGNGATLGDGVLAIRGQLDLVSSTIAGNLGDGLVVDGGDVSLLVSTVADNPGIGVSTVSGLLDVQNTAIGRNGTDVAGSLLQAYNCLGTTDFETNDTDANGVSSWFLAAGSTCIDAGDDLLAATAFAPFGLSWQDFGTMAMFSPDAGTVDAACHHEPPP